MIALSWITRVFYHVSKLWTKQQLYFRRYSDLADFAFQLSCSFCDAEIHALCDAPQLVTRFMMHIGYGCDGSHATVIA